MTPMSALLSLPLAIALLLVIAGSEASRYRFVFGKAARFGVSGKATGGSSLLPQSSLPKPLLRSEFLLENRYPLGSFGIQQPETDFQVFVVTVTNRLLSFKSDAPGTILTNVAITGLQPNENILIIDIRPASGELFGVGSSQRLYSINTTTGVAMTVAGPTSGIDGTDFGGDFNPVVDRLRLVSDLDQNLRLNPVTGAVTATDSPLAFASGDAHFGANPNVVAAAYTNSFADSAATSLYGIDSDLDILVLQGSPNGSPVSPNSGQLTTVGPLGVNTNSLAGLDILGSTNRALASLTSPGDSASKFYEISLSTGAATLLGTIGGSELVRDITVASGSFQFKAATAAIAESGRFLEITVTRTGNTSIPATVSFATGDETATQRADYILAQGDLNFAADETSKVFQLLLIDDVYVEGVETLTVRLSSPSADFALTGYSSTRISIADNDSLPPTTNPSDEAQFFVRQQYLDFLNREPDPGGLAFWTAEINSCGTNFSCLTRRRVEVSAAFFGEPEFQGTGFLIFLVYQAGLNRQPGYLEFMRGRNQLPPGPDVEGSRTLFVNNFVSRPEFTSMFPLSLSPAQYVDGLNANTENSLTQVERDALVEGLASGAETRATVLRKVAEHQTFARRQTEPAFVLMEYFGYLRREADTDGHAFWLNILRGSGNFRGMVCAFLTSAEYQSRFSPVHTRHDSECAAVAE